MTATVLADVIILVIAAYCAWIGYQKGLIIGICNILALVVAIYAANLIAVTYSGEFTGAMKPFLSGMVDNAVVSVIRGVGDARDDGDGGGLISTLTAEDGTPEDAVESADVVDYRSAGTVQEVTIKSLQKLGVTQKAAERIAEDTEEEMGTSEVSPAIKDIIAEKLCDVVAYIALFAISFVLIIIVFAVIENVINLEFRLPNMKYVDKIAGTAIGFARGIIIILLIGWGMRYMGLLFKEDAMASTVFLRMAMNSEFISGMMGI